jgi:hypothetical protein
LFSPEWLSSDFENADRRGEREEFALRPMVRERASRQLRVPLLAAGYADGQEGGLSLFTASRVFQTLSDGLVTLTLRFRNVRNRMGATQIGH